MLRLTRVEWVGVLQAWKTVRDASWPSLSSSMQMRSAGWAAMDAPQLEAETRHYLEEMNAPSCPVRVFWKRKPEYLYLGCNNAFARDGGHQRAEEMDGLDDFNPRVSWNQQAAKYRADDERVVAANKPLFDILERQTQPGGVVYVRTSKAPLRGAGGECFGILGMYETLDEATARRLFHAQMRAGK
jgi:hypothetical protein